MKLCHITQKLLILHYFHVWTHAISAPVHIEDTTPSTQQTVLYDDKVFELSCTASGSNIDKVTWYKDDQPLDDKYFRIWELETRKGNYQYEQTQAVRSIVQRKLESLEGKLFDFFVNAQGYKIDINMNHLSHLSKLQYPPKLEEINSIIFW